MNEACLIQLIAVAPHKVEVIEALNRYAELFLLVSASIQINSKLFHCIKGRSVKWRRLKALQTWLASFARGRSYESEFSLAAARIIEHVHFHEHLTLIWRFINSICDHASLACLGQESFFGDKKKWVGMRMDSEVFGRRKCRYFFTFFECWLVDCTKRCSNHQIIKNISNWLQPDHQEFQVWGQMIPISVRIFKTCGNFFKF